MENSNTIEETGASNVDPTPGTENDNAPSTILATASKIETNSSVPSAEKEHITEDGDFAADSLSEDADTECNESGNLAMSDNAGREADAITSIHEGDVAESNDLGAFNTFNTADDTKTNSLNEKGSVFDAYNDPFAHLSKDDDAAALDELSAFTSETATALDTEDAGKSNIVLSEIEESTSNGDNIEFFSTHNVNLVDSESIVESDDVQDGSPKSDAGYFSTVTDADGDEGTKSESGDGKTLGTAVSVKSDEPSDEDEEKVPKHPMSLATGGVPGLNATEGSLESSSIKIGSSVLPSEISTEQDVAANASETTRDVDNDTEDIEGVTVEGADDVLETENKVAVPEHNEISGQGAKGSDKPATGGDGFAASDAAPPQVVNDNVAQVGNLENDENDAACVQQADQLKLTAVIIEEAEVDDEIMVKEADDSNAVTDEDDFGEFGSFATNTEGLRSNDPVEDTENFAIQQEQEHTPVAPGESGDDDDFGDFSAFEQADSAATKVVEAKNLEQEPVDDDFGDFGAFEQAAETPSGTKSHEEPPKVEEPAEDDDFGDFGDFTDFAENPYKNDNEPHAAVGAAAAAAETSTGGASPYLSGSPTATVVDAVIEKADAVFQEVFRRGRGSTIETEDEQERVIVTVKSTLTDLTIDATEGPSEWYTTALESVMRGVEHLHTRKTGPIAVVNDFSEYPYAHFTVPVCGLPVTDVDIQGRSMRRRRPSKQAVDGPSPTVEPSFSLHSADSTESPAPAQQTTGTVVDLPPLEPDVDSIKQNGSRRDDSDFAFADFPSSKNDRTETSIDAHSSDSTGNGSKETLSSSAKQFLQQIPDLSFMLKPKLSLPKKS